MSLTVIVLTFNSTASLAQVIEACRPLGARLLVVDSYSSDGTPELARQLGCECVQHPFDNYARQRNWAQQYACLDAEDWVLHLDSDEVPSAQLVTAIRTALAAPPVGVAGFLMRRQPYFLGRPLRFGHLNPNWHLRLFQAGQGRCEDRLYDQHFIVEGPTRTLPGILHDLQLATLEQWTASHNRWSTLEAQEIRRQNSQTGTLRADLLGDPRMRRRWLKNNLWYRSPKLLRAVLFFFYAYFLRLGFLDGRAGLIYCVLQAFWFRFLVDAKLIEAEITSGFSEGR